LQFSNTNPDKNAATQEAIALCSANLKTDSSKCAYNVVCTSEGQSNQDLGISYSCTTSSHGENFSNTNYDLTIAKNVVATCQRGRFTDMNECQTNLRCKETKPEADAKCETNGYKDKSFDIDSAAQGALSACYKAGKGVQCRLDLECESSKVQRKKMYDTINCTTTVNGNTINAKDSDVALAAKAIEAQCSKAGANMDECRSKMTCDGVTAAGQRQSFSLVACKTSSKGAAYTASNIDKDKAAKSTELQCTKAPGANAGECRANLVCADGNKYYPQIRVCQTSSKAFSTIQAETDMSNQQFEGYVFNLCSLADDTVYAECRRNMKCDIQANRAGDVFSAK
jgi:hypothetical protein